MNIAVRLEGGIGDCLLGNRFIPAIKEIYPSANITAWVDSEGKTFQKEALSYTYGHLYSSINVIPNRKQKEFWIESKLGRENYPAALENLPDNVVDALYSADAFYDLHVDSLKWMSYDFDWLRYFRFFPRPMTRASITRKSNQIVLHIVSTTSTAHRLEDWYVESLVNKLCDTFGSFQVVAIATKEVASAYSNINKKNFRLHVGTIESAIDEIAKSSLMIATDSGFRFFAYGLSIPTFTFSSYCRAPYQIPAAFAVRWHVFPETTYPLNYDMNEITRVAQGAIFNDGTAVVPWVRDFDRECIKRRYTVCESQ